MSLVFKEIMPPKSETGWKNRNVAVTVETHKKIKEISQKTGYSMGDVAEKLIQYALEEIEWTK